MIHKEKKKIIEPQVTQLSTSRIPDGFTEKTARVNGVTLELRDRRHGAGRGTPARLPADLVHVAEGDARPRRAVHRGQLDLRGSGGSDAPATGYDKASLAEDIHQLLLALGHANEVNLGRHDIGGIVPYAYAAAHRDSIRRLTIVESPQIDESPTSSRR